MTSLDSGNEAAEMLTSLDVGVELTEMLTSQAVGVESAEVFSPSERITLYRLRGEIKI